MKLLNLLLLIGMSIALVNCAEPTLKLKQQISKPVGGFCVAPPVETQQLTKFLFVIDKSGSNRQFQQLDPATGTIIVVPGTDPECDKRCNNIEKFVDELGQSEYYEYGMISFQQEKADAIINGGGLNDPIFTKEVQEVYDGINALRSQIDDGATPFGSALDLVDTAIRNDKIRFPEQDAYYMIFFVSDGEPTDVNNDEELFIRIKNMKEAYEGRFFLSTAYYGPENFNAEDRMQKMAKEGNGEYTNFRLTNDIDFEKLIVTPSREPWRVREFMIYNLNATVCANGSVGADSDSDGLCDVDEIVLGFDPNNKFSNGDGFGDYFHWRKVKYGEKLPMCNDRSDLDMDFLTKCEEEYLENKDPALGEKNRADPENPDTDLDGLLDGIEAFNFRSTKSAAIDSLNIYKSYDGELENAREQIMQARNPEFYDPNADKAEVVFAQTGINEKGQQCFELIKNEILGFATSEPVVNVTQPYMNHKANENVYMIYYIQTPQNNPQAEGVMSYSFKTIKTEENSELGKQENNYIDLDTTVFDNYIVPVQ